MMLHQTRACSRSMEDAHHPVVRDMASAFRASETRQEEDRLRAETRGECVRQKVQARLGNDARIPKSMNEYACQLAMLSLHPMCKGDVVEHLREVGSKYPKVTAVMARIVEETLRSERKEEMSEGIDLAREEDWVEWVETI